MGNGGGRTILEKLEKTTLMRTKSDLAEIEKNEFYKNRSKYGSNTLENIISHKKCAQMIEPIFDCLSDEELKTAFYSLSKAQQDILDTIISTSLIKKRIKKIWVNARHEKIQLLHR